MRKRIIISILLILMFVGGAFLLEKGYAKYGQVSGKTIKITNKDTVVALISSDVLKELMKQKTEKYDEDLCLGPTLLSTLNAAGISNFNEIEVIGNKDSLILNKKDITDDFELAISSNGSINLEKEGDNSRVLINKVTEISVKN